MTQFDTDIYDIIKSQFVFTNEGRRLLINQEGGVKFAILGYMIVQGIDPKIDLFKYIEDHPDMNLKDMVEKKQEYGNLTFIMRDVNYKSTGKNSIMPKQEDLYNEALENWTDHLFGIYYVPTNEFMVRKVTKTVAGEPIEQRVPYGMYRFNFDSTYLSCKITSDINFSHILLFGKQYAETDDATFNIDDVQDGAIVAIAKFDGAVEKESGTFEGGVQILADQNKYVSFQTQLRMTVREDEYLNKEDDPIVEIDEEILENSKKLHLVNNGVKTLSGGVAIGYDKEVLEELELDKDGAIALDKSLMVADCIDADDAENQFNGTGLVHAINKYQENAKHKRYIPQYVLTSVKATSALEEDIIAYTVGMQLRCEGMLSYYNATPEVSDVDSPVFILGHLPQNDYTVVDIFGKDNKNNNKNWDRYLFSNDNSATQPSNGMPNVIINSDNNLFLRGGSNNDNSFYNSNYNTLRGGSYNNTLFESDFNKIDNGFGEGLLLHSNYNTLENVVGTMMYNSDNNFISGAANYNTLFNSHVNSAKDSAEHNILFNSNENIFSADSRYNTLYNSTNNQYRYGAHNNVTFDSYRNEYWNAQNSLVTHSTWNKIWQSNRDTIYNTNLSHFQEDASNKIYDSTRMSAYSAENNSVYHGRHFGLFPVSATSINSNERPLASDFMSNNNMVFDVSYFSLYGSSDNMILGSYGLRGSDSVLDPGPVRVKGSSIIGSDGAKLQNVREVYMWNSDYSRAFGGSHYSDADIGLVGSSWSLTNYTISQIDSIMTGAHSGGSGLSGTSYKEGAESISNNCRPADMLRLKTQFINTYGSELNLYDWNPAEHKNANLPYYPGAAFEYQNNTLMADSIRPNNSVILGGNHNKMVGGQNVVFLGGEYTKASSKEHQILMGKYNRDTPADIIFGCGHFNGQTFTQGNKEYHVSELKTIETLDGTIDNVRNASTLINAMEFYAHQGKMILRNCDDGEDRGGGAVSKDYGKTVEVSPTGFTFRARNNEVIGTLNPESFKSSQPTNVYIEWDDVKHVYYVSNITGPNLKLIQKFKSIGGQKMFDMFFWTGVSTTTNAMKYILKCSTDNKTFTIEPPVGAPRTYSPIQNPSNIYDEDDILLNSGIKSNASDAELNGHAKNIGAKIAEISSLLYDNGTKDLQFIFKSVVYHTFLGAGVGGKQADYYLLNSMFLVYPWYTQPNKAPRFVSEDGCKITFTAILPNNAGTTATGHDPRFFTNVFAIDTNLLYTNNVCQECTKNNIFPTKASSGQSWMDKWINGHDVIRMCNSKRAKTTDRLIGDETESYSSSYIVYAGSIISNPISCN